MVEISQLKTELAEICKEIYQRDLVRHGEGNVSMRVEQKEQLIITPSGNDYSHPKAEKMVHIDFLGNILGEASNPSSEYFMHRKIYQNRPGVACILHTHSPYAAALSVSHISLPVIIEEMVLFLGGGVPCTKFASAGSEDLPLAALESMGNQNAVLLANHGVLIVGKTLEYCVKTAVIIEKMAKIYIHAQMVGSVHVIPDEKQKKIIEIFKQKYATKHNSNSNIINNPRK